MPEQCQMWLRHLVFMGCLLFVDAAPRGVCPLDSHSDYVTAICFGPLQSHRPFINWTLSTREHGDTLEVEITCDTAKGRCTQSKNNGLEASLTTSGKAFISAATFRTFESGRGSRYVTCSTWGGKNLVAGAILCHTAISSEMEVRRCEDVLQVDPHFDMLCEETAAYCGIYEETGKRAKSSNLTDDAEPVALQSVCKRMTVELALERFKRDTQGLDLDIGNAAKCAEIKMCTSRNTGCDFTPVYGCHEPTGGDMKIKCHDKKTYATLNVTCYFNGTNVTTSLFQVDHKTNNYDNLFCLCSVEPTPVCNRSNSYTFVGFAFKNKNQSCKSSEVEDSNSFSLFYIFAGVLSVYCFIFVSATCAFIAKHGAGLYAYYYMDLYRKVKMELTNQNKPPLPPPRLPPRRLTACSVNNNRSEPAVVFDESTGSSDHHEEEVALFKTHSNFQNSSSGQAALLPVMSQGIDDENLDDGYLVPKFLSLPCNRGNSVASNLKNSTPTRLHSLKETCPRITGKRFPPPLPCRRQDGNVVVSEFKCTNYDSTDSISYQGTSLDSDDSLSICSIDDYT